MHFSPALRIVTAALGLLLLHASCAAPRPVSDGKMRAVWITRWDYRTADDVRQIVENCEDAGFDTLVFQVRGNATAFYRSSIEPWAEELGGSDPGYDPLGLAVELAHARGMALHAWVNVVPAAWDTTPPADPKHVWNTHPEWLWYDQHGARQGLSKGFYASLNPCLPEVRGYIVDVLREIATNYAIDGLHLDYIRFPNEPPAVPKDSGLDYPRDERTLALFRAEKGCHPDEDARAWQRWRTEQVTRLCREIRGMLDVAAPAAQLSAAVGSEPGNALHHHQDVEGWLAEGLLDLVFPMNYTADPALFAQRVDDWVARGRDARVVMGIMASGDARLRRDQVRQAGAAIGDRAIFAYHCLFDSRNQVLGAQSEAASRERTALRNALVPALHEGTAWR